MPRITTYNLQIESELHAFLIDEALPGTGIEADDFFQSLSAIVEDLAPKNLELLAKRDTFQDKIDNWHRDHGASTDLSAYRAFLEEIGYLLPEGPNFKIETRNVDPEMSSIAGPQLVVPIMNARYALNAANARWGSLYDALYGTDAISEASGATRSGAYNPERGEKVIGWVRSFLDDVAPLGDGSWRQASGFTVDRGVLKIHRAGKASSDLFDPAQFAGYRGSKEKPEAVILVNHGLHIDIIIDPRTPIGSVDTAGISDVLLESALTTIMDCEDSVAAVDAQDKTLVYRNWLGLMKGDLEETVAKNGKQIIRRLNPDRTFIGRNGTEESLKGRSLMLVRNVGHLMTNPAILDRDGNEIPEGILDAMVTSLIALHDIGPNGRRANSTSGSLYIVKPKMHGPEEVAFACELFARVEDALGMTRNVIKIGLMDEERRTTVNLKECIRAAKERLVFINTGFLDRTGDEIHTSMEAGIMMRKADMKRAVWLQAYENWNVDNGLAAGLSGVAQIGKGMWAMPDLMADMLEQKIGHPKAGASTAWVPSPTAATLHATHYHRINVHEVQQTLTERPRAKLDDILSIPVAPRPNWTDEEIQQELDNNAQSILGYVVRWINQGIGCSKVPDINNVGLMEDRATLRISAQHIANWLRHGLVDKSRVEDTFRRMAQVVDRQNAGDPDYIAIGKNPHDSIALQAALELVLEGTKQPNGYTEPCLHKRRREFKASIARPAKNEALEA
ncbi:malate synthase G [Limoniibacter endophyticus]|uniref:Malate synthase G n=1 Tax=Limoniibacter endophyticus TaxID=1565040 RepID=A0A8J3DQ01_9HYPH|nr:malate synthase G [Limoniibacter endophyticus]GHC72496.1 malate synthase G [Limoniibacter endophyticus]